MNEPYKRTTLSAEQLAIVNGPSLASQLPLVFENGSQWLKISTKCAECDTHIGADSMKARITRPIASVYVVDALGYCLFCDLWTRANYRFRDDMSFDGEIPGRPGLRGRWQMRPSGFFGKLRQKLGLLGRMRS